MIEAQQKIAEEVPRAGYVEGDVIARKYRLIRLLGAGGMSWVWLAQNIDLEVDVAIKLIRTDLQEDTIAERLLGEARTIARLGHRAIVRVFDFGATEQGDPFIVMEVLHGETLSQHLSRRGRFSPVELVRTLLPVIDGLHAAHLQGIVHRDLKPDNILLSEGGEGIQPKLLDFGIAKLKNQDKLKDPRLTQVGTVVGSPFYMSPEQARGDQDLDSRSDVFALNVLLYECLTHSMPFNGEGYNSVMWAIIEKEPKSIVELGVGEAALWEILKKGLSKSREKRWQTARAMGEALARWLESKGVTEDICSRSLRASWLPDDRPTPTQPILAIPEASVPRFPAPDPTLALDAPAMRGLFARASKPAQLGIVLGILLIPTLALLLILSDDTDADELRSISSSAMPSEASQATTGTNAKPTRKPADVELAKPESIDPSEIVLKPSSLPRAAELATVPPTQSPPTVPARAAPPRAAREPSAPRAAGTHAATKSQKSGAESSSEFDFGF